MKLCRYAGLCVQPTSLPSWERGLKQMYSQHVLLLSWSLPSWERGLKLPPIVEGITGLIVAPLVGAWIETDLGSYKIAKSGVAPLVGAWIETT